MAHFVIGILIFAATLAAVMTRPRRLPEAAAAAAGGMLMLLGGFVGVREGIGALAGEWNIYGFFLGLMTISALADQAGIFDRIAAQAGVWAGGSARRLYLVIFIAGALLTAFLYCKI